MSLLPVASSELSIPPLFGVSERIDRNLIGQIIVPARTAEFEIFEEGERIALIKDKDGAEYLVQLKRSSNQISAKLPVLEARHIETAEDLVGATKLKWKSHPSLESSITKPELIAQSWQGCFRFVEEDREAETQGLRDAQIGAIHAVSAHMMSGDSEPATVVLPTGTGKTETMLSLLIYRKITRLLVIVPSDALRTQLADKFLGLGCL